MLVNRNVIRDVVKDSDHMHCEEVLDGLNAVDCLAAGVVRMRLIQWDMWVIMTTWWV